MTMMMNIAAGLSIGYFANQYLSNKRATRGRLHRSRVNKKISGVCAGVAEYLGVDPTIIRIVWAMLCCGWGTGILLYFLFALLLPEE